MLPFDDMNEEENNHTSNQNDQIQELSKEPITMKNTSKAFWMNGDLKLEQNSKME